jgi:hypothetical protein
MILYYLGGAIEVYFIYWTAGENFARDTSERA